MGCWVEIPASGAASVAIFALTCVMWRWYRSCASASGAAATPISAARGRGIATAARCRRWAVIAGCSPRLQAIPIGSTSGGTTGCRGWTGRAVGRGLGIGGAAGGTAFRLGLRFRFGFGLRTGLLLAAGTGLCLLLVRRAIGGTGGAMLWQEATHKGLFFRHCRGIPGCGIPGWAGRLGILACRIAAGCCRCCRSCGCGCGCHSRCCRRTCWALGGRTAVTATGSLGLLDRCHLGGNGRLRLLDCRSGSCIRVCGARGLS